MALVSCLYSRWSGFLDGRAGFVGVVAGNIKFFSSSSLLESEVMVRSWIPDTVATA